jgi:hypothetical protein
MPKATPADDLELQNRVDEVKTLITKGMIQKEIVRYFQDKHADYELSDRQIRNYVYEAKKQLSDDAPAIDRRREFTLAKLRNDLLFNSSFKLQDFKTALSANVQNIKLMRLDDPKFKMDWRQVAEAAGLDPDETMKQFVELMNAQASQDALGDESEGDYAND